MCLSGNQLLKFVTQFPDDMWGWVDGITIVFHAETGDVFWRPLFDNPSIWCIVS